MKQEGGGNLTRLSLPNSEARLHVPPSNWKVFASQNHIIRSSFSTTRQYHVSTGELKKYACVNKPDSLPTKSLFLIFVSFLNAAVGCVDADKCE